MRLIINPIITLLLIFLMSGLKSSAQITGLEIIPIDSLHTDLGYDSYNLSFIYLKNNRADSLFLTWEIKEKDLSSDWYVTICDNVLCYGVLPDSADMYGIAPSDSVYIRFEVNPYYVDGFGRVDLELRETDVLSQSIQPLKFTFLTKNSTNVINSLDDVSIVAYPNPFQDYLFLQNPFADDARVSFINSKGQKYFMGKLTGLEKRQISPPDLIGDRMFVLFETKSETKIIPLIRIH
ncbi:MAG: hypothetical protein P8P48_03075 [Saprospiraceae bacterium]|nr:hypothetical protein [Saprospiraceae bacterium]